MTTEYDIDRSENNINKRVRILIMKKRETPAPHNTCNLNEHLINKIKCPISGCKFRVVRKRSNECVK